MKYVLESIFGGALFVGGLLLVWIGAAEPQRQNLAVAEAIILAAAYLGGPGSVLRQPTEASKGNWDK